MLHSSSDRSHGTETRHSGRFTALLGLINFFAMVVDPGRSHLHAKLYRLASCWVHPLPPPPSICPSWNPRSVGSDLGMGGYRVDTSENTPVKSADSSTPVLGQSVGGVGGLLKRERHHRRLERMSQIPPHNHLEMLAVKLACQQFKSELQLRTVLLLCDNKFFS